MKYKHYNISQYGGGRNIPEYNIPIFYKIVKYIKIKFKGFKMNELFSKKSSQKTKGKNDKI